MRVLVVDDDEDTRDTLEHALVHSGYEVTTARNGVEAIELIRQGHCRVVVSDWEMPEMSGVELCRQVRQRMSSTYIYFILLTAHKGTRNVVEGLNAGADEFLTKPFSPRELDARLRVAERILSLETRDLLIFSLAKLAETRDTDTGAHLERIRAYCYVLADRMSRTERFADRIDGDYVQLLYMTSPLHDIGKVGIPDAILLKPGKLTPEEYEIMKTHAVIGGRTLEAAARAYPDAQYLQMACDIALSHHEKFDGTGYPRGLKGEEIPLCGRIVAVSDVYDALTTARVYKPAFTHDFARQTIIKGSGKHFDPDVVEAFLAEEQKIVAIKDQWTDGMSAALTSAAPCASFHEIPAFASASLTT